MRTAILAPCVVALALSGVAGAADETSPTLEGALAALASSDAAARRQGGADLERLLADRTPSDSALVRIRAALRSRLPETRADVVRALGRATGPDAERLWIERLDPDEDDRVIAAALAAAGTRESGSTVERSLVDVARDAKSSAGRRALALEALGACDGPAAWILLSSPRPGATVLEESCRALGLGRRGGADAVPPLLALLAHEDVEVRVHAWESLTRITRRSIPPERGAWETWWRTEGAKGGGSLARPPADPYGEARPAHVPTYYGIPIEKPRARVVFCLDVSASMWGDGIDHARAHLAATIRELPSSCSFEIVTFDERVARWAGRLVPAHPVTKARAIAFLDAIVPVSFTNLYDAIESAFALAGRGPKPAADAQHVDAIFVLSDGAPNRGRHVKDDAIVEAVARLSQGTIPVHTVGAGDSVAALLRRIAAATGGTYVDAGAFE